MNLQVNSVSFSYQQPVLQDIQLEIAGGTFFALIGPNGSGKTTLLRLISGVLSSSAIFLDSYNLQSFSNKDLAQIVTMVHAEKQANFDFSVREIVEMGRIPYLYAWQALRNLDERIIQNALVKTHTTHLQNRRLCQLSSGEKQRVWLAMALAQEPKILLLDEPIAHLDIAYQIEILQLLKKLTKENITIILTLHDLNLAGRFATEMALLQNGKILVQGCPKEVLQEKWLSQAFQTKFIVWQTPDGELLVYPA